MSYRLPAEWEPHAATWIAWPHNPETWPGNLERIPPIWIKMIKVLHQHETVHLCVNDEAMEGKVRALLLEAGIDKNVRLHQIPTNDAWIRDYGPMFVETSPNPLLSKEGAPGTNILDWAFNSWGEKYGPWDLDDVVPQRVAEIVDVPCWETGIVLEGGSIDVNGQGSLLTTEQCLLNENRNPQLSKTEIEQSLKDHLGVTNILWLGEGIVGDDTDGHVDDIARFVDPTTVVAVLEEDPADENYVLLQDNLKRLRAMKDQTGQDLNIVTLPMPLPFYYEGQRLPASYANFYIANGVVLVPIFDEPNDQKAIEVLQALFPDRRVVGLDARDLVWGLGAFHCVTQQMP